jgi:hypothetical protein
MRLPIVWGALVAHLILVPYAAGRARPAAPTPVPAPDAPPRPEAAPEPEPALPAGPLPDDVTRLDMLPVLRAELDALEHEIAAIEAELRVAFGAEGTDDGSGEDVSGEDVSGSERRRV